MRRSSRRELLVRGTTDHYVDTDLYDFEYEDHVKDIEWYCRVAAERAGGGPILELGAGTGRVTIPLAMRGHDVWALDRLQGMLDALARKLARRGEAEVRGKITMVLGDMTELPFEDGVTKLVLAPFNALMHLYRWEDLLACFREVHRVLAPGGTFALDVLLPDLEWLLWDPEARHSVTRFVHPVSARKLFYSTNHTYDQETQVCHIRVYYDDATRGRPRPDKEPLELVHLAHRQIFPEELRALLAWAGFELEEHTGDFAGLLFEQGIESQVVIARRS